MFNNYVKIRNHENPIAVELVEDTSADLEFTGLYRDEKGKYILSLGEGDCIYSENDNEADALAELYCYINKNKQIKHGNKTLAKFN